MGRCDCRGARSTIGLYKYEGNRVERYIYLVMNEHRKYIIRVRISAYFTLPGLGATVRAAAIAHFFHRQFFIKLNSTTRQLQLRNTVLYLSLNAASVAFILQCYSAWISVITFQAGKENIVLQSIKKLHTPIHSF